LIRPFNSHEDRARCVELQELIWGAGYTDKLSAAVLIVAQKLGGVTSGAFDDDGRLLGFVIGMTGLRHGRLVHWSDMLAVHPDAAGRKLGEALKEHQRKHCETLGIESIQWTYDPLVAKNAHLNLNRLGARVDEFVVSFYGDSTKSPLQGDMPTDRFIVDWAVDRSRAAAPLAELPPRLPLIVGPDASEGELLDVAAVGVRIPRDIVQLVSADLETARRWRFATRRAFLHYLPPAAGYLVRGFVADADGGTYLLERAAR
jgi:predicted GNAT superfamily acetyltransferase